MNQYSCLRHLTVRLSLFPKSPIATDPESFKMDEFESDSDSDYDETESEERTQKCHNKIGYTDKNVGET